MPSKLMMGLIRIYQRFISPFIVAVAGPQCRFHPSCSQYAIEAIEKYGIFKGSWLAARRIARCQPRSKGGFDPVP